MIQNESEESSKVSDSSDGNRKMSRALDWQAEIEVIAGPMLASDTRESWLARAARRASITFRQCKALYYRETADPKHSVASGVIEAAALARKEASELASQFESLAGSINANAKITDVYSDEVVALIQAAQRLRGVDRA
jgi:hypothetical protein